MPQVAFTTLGCKVNQFETEVMEGLFIACGYDIVSFSARADVYIINTCSVTHLGERKSRQLIRRATRLNPEAVIAVTGCYAQVSPDKVAEIPGVDVIVGTQDRQRIVDLVKQAALDHRTEQFNIVSDIMHTKEFEDIPLFSRPGRTRAFLKIQEGCTNFCTYCIIPYARGPLRSRALNSIAAETEKLVAAGFAEIVLTGIHLGAYGRDISNRDKSITLVDAVQTVLAAGGSSLLRIRLGSLESIEVSEELLQIMQTDKRLCPHLHLPLQSGDDRILKAMNRHYTAAHYWKLITDIKTRIPGIAITTDIITGFPGETTEMFEVTLAFVTSMNFAQIHVFPYSRRIGTPAAEFSDQVSEAEKKQRVQLLQQLADNQEIKFQTLFLGKQLDVLFEPPMSGDIISGLTANYIRVYTKGSQAMFGLHHMVKLEEMYQSGLWGALIE